MNGKKIKKSSKSSYMQKLKSCLKTELAIVHLTTDNKKFLNQYKAIIHESTLREQRDKERRWKEMTIKIAELVCEVLKEKKWGIFFKNEPIQALPVQDSTTIFRVNEVKDEEVTAAIISGINERMSKWESPRPNQTENESLDGMKTTSGDTKE